MCFIDSLPIKCNINMYQYVYVYICACVYMYKGACIICIGLFFRVFDMVGLRGGSKKNTGIHGSMCRRDVDTSQSCEKAKRTPHLSP